MENHVLSAVRMHGASADVPDYEENALEIRISFSENLTSTRELSVRVYNSVRHLMGAGMFATGRPRSIGRCGMLVHSAESWDDGCYTVLVYRNAEPMWIAALVLDSGDEPCSARLEALDGYPRERFFAQEVCRTSWWTKLDSGVFSVSLLEMTLDRLYKVSERICPTNMLVAGSRAGVFSRVALAGYASGDNNGARFGFSLEELFAGVLTIDSLQQQIAGKRSVDVQLYDREYGNRAKSLLAKFLALILRGTFHDTTFIFYGSVEDVMRFDSESRSAGLFFPDYAFISLDGDDRGLAGRLQCVLPDLEDLESEFMPGLEYFDTDFDEDEEDCCTGIASGELPAEDAMERMVGMQRLKDEIADARIMALFRRERMKMRLDTASDNRNHMLFLGNPGTGKTTVAKLIGVMYHEIGMLSSGHTVMVDRTRLVGQYIGHTEDNIRSAIDKARGGVLFIDEAYTLFTGEDDRKDYGRSVLAALLPLLSEPEPDMIVIMAGYEDKMQELLDSNPGLRDRFPLRFHFDDYSADELLEIARRACSGMNYELTPAAETRLKEIIDDAVSRHDRYFGNGRWVNNLIEHGILKSMARRVMSLGRSGDRRLFSLIEECDVAEAERVYLRGNMPMVKPVRKIGFIA